MAAQTIVEVIINAKDNATGAIKGLQSQLGGLGKSLNNVGADFQNFGKIALAGVAGLVAFATKAAFSAARVEELTFALHAIAKANDISKQAVDETVTSLRDFNIAHDKALQVTSKFVQAQLDLTDAVKLANTAKDLAVIAGMDSSEATDILTDAILTQFPIQLRQFGIVKSLDQIYEDYAETTGKTAHNLTQLEKRQAFLNTILTEGKKVAGTYDAAMESVSKRFRSLTGRIIPDFLAEVGKAFTPALIAVIDAITESIKEMSTWITENKDRIAGWGAKLGEIAVMVVGGFKEVVGFLIKNKEIIIGIFAAIGVAIGLLVGAFVVAHAAFFAIVGAIVIIVTLLAKVWTSNFLGIQTAMTNCIESFRQWYEYIKIGIQGVIDFLTGTILPLLQGWFEGVKNLLAFYLASWQFVFAVIKDVVNIVVGWLEAYVLPHIETFFENIKSGLQALANWFNYIWTWIKTNVVQPVISWFMTYVWPTIQTAFEKIKTVAINLWLKIQEVFDWIREKVESVINFIRDLIDRFKPTIKIGLELPNVEAAWENLKARARYLGIPGFQTGGVVPGPIGAPVPVLAHAGERIIPAGIASSTGVGGGGITFEVNIGLYAGAETEKREIAKELYGALVRTALAQNKSVSELMGG